MAASTSTAPVRVHGLEIRRERTGQAFAQGGLDSVYGRAIGSTAFNIEPFRCVLCFGDGRTC